MSRFDPIKRIKGIWAVIKESLGDFWASDPMNHAAAIAFYTIFSLPAILIMIISFAGAFFFGQKRVQQELYTKIGDLVGPEASQRVQTIVENTPMVEPSTVANIIGIGILVFSATTVFTILQHSLNITWRVKEKPEKSSILKLLIDRGLSFLMVIFLGTIMFGTLLLDTALVLINEYIESSLPEISGIFQLSYIFNLVNYLLSTVVITIIFALIFKVLPDVVVKWKDVWIGAIVTTLLFLLGKYLMGLYLENTPMTSAYGAAGSLVILLMWVYYSAFIILYGGNFTKIHAKHFGRKTIPRKRAVEYEIKEVEHEGEMG